MAIGAIVQRRPIPGRSARKNRSACRGAGRRFVLWIRRSRRETMQKKVIITRITLDGIMQAPGVSL